MEAPTISNEPKQKVSKFALIWIALIVFCLLFFAVSLGLLGWGGYALLQQSDEKRKIPYATATAAAQWPIVFRDDFGKVSDRWYTGDYTEKGRHDARSISNGVYTWSLENASGFTYWYPSGAGTYQDFTVSVDVKHTVGAKYDGYGLIFCNVAGNYYGFGIYDSGDYSVFAWSAGKWNEIIPLTKSSAVKPGEFNHLMVLGQRGVFKLFINNEFVQEFRDNTLPSGDVGLMLDPANQQAPLDHGSNGVVYTFANSTTQAVFDNFELRAPEGSADDPNLPSQLPQIEPEKGKLVFASNRNGERSIYSISTKGSGLKKLTSGPDANYSPRWSPDGKKIVFVSRHGNNSEIYVMDADGSNLVRLTDNPANDTSPDWSPDGKQIIFSSDRDKTYDLYLMSAQGEKLGISKLTDTDTEEINPTISPDGTQILFQRKDVNANDPEYKLYVMGMDGKQQKPFTNINDYADYTDGAWSPDGIHFAYVMKYNSEDAEIMVGDVKHAPDYSGNGEITWHQGANLYPCWSPTGRQIAFVSNMDGQSDIYVILPDGNGIFRVTHTEAIESSPDWHE